MLGKALIAMLGAIAVVAGAAAAESLAPGVIDLGPYRLAFSATQRSGDRPTEKFHREIPAVGPTMLTLELAEAPQGAPDAADLKGEVELLREKNQFDPPELLATLELPKDGRLAFDYDFAVEGKYIIAARAKDKDGAIYRAQYPFFVIQTEESHPFLVGALSAACIAAAIVIWRGRSKSAAGTKRRI